MTAVTVFDTLFTVLEANVILLSDIQHLVYRITWTAIQFLFIMVVMVLYLMARMNVLRLVIVPVAMTTLNSIAVVFVTAAASI